MEVAQASDARVVNACQSPVMHKSEFKANESHDHEQLLYGSQTRQEAVAIVWEVELQVSEAKQHKEALSEKWPA